MYLLYSLFKRPESLAEVIQNGIKAHASKHGDIFSNHHVHSRKQQLRRFFGNTITYQIAAQQVDRELSYMPPDPAFILEREVFVQKKADDAAYNIIGRRRKPVGAVRQIVEQEHGSRSENSVDNSHQQELRYGGVDKLSHGDSEPHES